MDKQYISPYLAGVKKVEFALAENVEIDYFEKLAPGVPVIVRGDFEEICIEGLGEVEQKQVTDRGQILYNSTLKFRASNESDDLFDLPAILARGGAVYRLTLTNGWQYLMGTNQKPFTSLQSVNKNPSSAAGAHITEYEVSYVNVFGLLGIYYHNLNMIQNAIEQDIKNPKLLDTMMIGVHKPITIIDTAMPSSDKANDLLDIMNYSFLKYSKENPDEFKSKCLGTWNNNDTEK